MNAHATSAQGGREAAILEDIYRRRSVRDYFLDPVDRATITALARAATQAPSEYNRQPWAFFVLQDRKLLAEASVRIKEDLLRSLDADSPYADLRESLADPEYDVFYGAGTLLTVCATAEDPEAAEECCLAAQNLMLAAHAMGLGTCPIGIARPWLSESPTKRRVRMPAAWRPVLPLVVGVPRKIPLPRPRREPEIVFFAP